MRSSLLMLFSIGAVAGACGSHPLTGDMTGSGGAGTGGAGALSGGTGGSGNPGTGGSDGAAIANCTQIASDYQQALPASMACDVGGAEQCQQPVASALSVCGSCPVAVTDPSKLQAIQQLWDAANCPAVLPKIPCVAIDCIDPIHAYACMPADGGTRGVCSLVPGGGNPGTGGTSGDGGACAALAEKYAGVLATMRSCSAGAAGQCAHAVAARLSPCRDGCVQYVNDSTELDDIQQAWLQQGCGSQSVACPALSCGPAAGGVCVAGDGGAGLCSVFYDVLI